MSAGTITVTLTKHQAERLVAFHHESIDRMNKLALLSELFDGEFDDLSLSACKGLSLMLGELSVAQVQPRDGGDDPLWGIVKQIGERFER